MLRARLQRQCTVSFAYIDSLPKEVIRWVLTDLGSKNRTVGIDERREVAWNGPIGWVGTEGHKLVWKVFCDNLFQRSPMIFTLGGVIDTTLQEIQDTPKELLQARNQAIRDTGTNPQHPVSG
ncbi:hypothetical protein AS032_00255 [Rhodococcus qingshengii]|nr:hypothetical protein AS032_00255 [Rhodococcus qingshengii]